MLAATPVVLFEQPQWLWLMLLAIPMGIVGWWWFRTMAGPRRVLAVVLRTLLIGVLLALLAGVMTMSRTSKLAVIGVVDVSGSVQRFYRVPEDVRTQEGTAGLRDARDVARWYLSLAMTPRRAGEGSKPTTGLVQEDWTGLVVFDGRAIAMAVPGPGNAGAMDMGIQTTSGTNIADALRVAASLVPPDANGRLVLVSDGNETAGDALIAARELAARAGVSMARSGPRPMPIDVVPLEYELRHEVVVERVDAPPSAVAQATVNVRVVLWASSASEGVLQLTRDGTPLDLNGNDPGVGRRVRLAAGRNVELVEVALPAGRVHRFAAVYEPDVVANADPGSSPAFSGDTVLENNRAQSFTLTPGKGNVLLVDGVSQGREDGAGLTLVSVLRRAGIEVSVVAPSALPSDVLGLEAFDMIVLENVSADAVLPEVQQQLITYVRDMGGGLCVVGGPDAFGAGGWIGSPLAAVLPVELQLPDRVVSPEVATMLVIDNSGSMRRPVLGSTKDQQQIANDAAALAISSLDRNDLVGVITFNSTANLLIPMGRNRDPQRTVELVRGISSGGGTDLVEAVELATKQLRDVEAKVKHLVVLTDGKSQRQEELPGLAVALKEMGVKITTIAVGDDVDGAMLLKIAQIGGGAAYSANNPLALPQIFLKAVRVVRSPLLREQDFTPVVLASGSGMTAGLREIPPLGGLVLTRPRQDPTVSLAMAAPTGEPVLAHWNVGLGQVVAFTSDAHAWARRWVDWPGYERMWTQVVRLASRPPQGSGVLASLSERSGQLTLRAEALDAEGKPALDLTVPATIYSPSGAAREIMLAGVGPGLYEATIAAEETGSYIALVKPRDAAGTRLAPSLAGSTVQEGAEYRTLASNTDVLREIASATGGRVLDVRTPSVANLFDRTKIPPSESLQRWWQQCLVLAIVLLLLDIANRRIAWDRFTSAAFAERVRASTSNAAATVAGLRRAAEMGEGASTRAQPSLALGEAQAKELIQAARDRRRQERLGGAATLASHPKPPAKSQPTARVVDATASQDVQSDSGLRAAKKRAAQRFDEET